ncbi:MAG TPA: hypothetical protein VLB50_05540 [Ignavibacteriaceae bacterium]|nr:hypothetical protein [Ignavibacteriaceae bacterium]
MAEIKIQRRQRSPWPWIIGIVILAAIIWFILNYVYKPDNSRNQAGMIDRTYYNDSYRAPLDTTNEVKDFINFTNGTSKPLDPKRYVEKGLIKLQSALSYLADKIDTLNNSVIDKNVDSLDIAVAEVDTSSSNYLSELKPAFSSALKVMASIQYLKFPELAGNISNLKNVANSINVRSTINSQFTKIQQFYIEAGNTLKQMKLLYAYNFP